MLDRTIAPPFQALSIPAFVFPETEILKNGIELSSYPSEAQNLVTLEMVFPFSNVEAKSRQMELYTFKMMLEGTVHKTAKQFADEVSFLGASIDISHYADYELVQINCLGRILPAAFQLWKEAWSQSIFPEKEWKTILETTRQQNAINLQKTSFLVGKIFRKTLYSDKMEYGYSFDLPTVESFTTTQFLAKKESMQNMGPALVLLAGKISPEAINEIREWLNGFSTKGEKPVFQFDKYKKPEPGEVWAEKQDAQQASLRIGNFSIPKSHPDSPVLNLVFEIYGGYFGSRLMSNIREEKGWTYGIFAQRVGNLEMPFWVIGTDIKGDVIQEAITEINLEARILREERISEEELDLVKNYMLGQYLSSITHCFGWADRYKSLWLAGISPEKSIENLKVIQESDGDAVMKVAQNYLWPEKAVVAISGKKS
jgi:predicted Zn-dependent peptidase